MSMPRTIRLIVTILYCAVWTTVALDQTSADNLATYCLGQLARVGGVASVPLSTDGTLARALLMKSSMSVHAMCGQSNQLGAIRSTAESGAGATARLYVEPGSPGALPYSSNFIDLVIVNGLTSADLSTVSRDEILRVLSPGGMAFIGRAVSEGAGLTTSALQTWAGASSAISVQTNANGTWAIVTKPRLAGSDEWTHFMHGPDNNPASNDSLVKWPFLPQWRQRPTGNHRWGAVVSGGGRTYTMRNEWNMDQALAAFRTANGSRLWYKRLADAEPGMDPSAMVASATGVYVHVGNTVQELDGETGNVRRTITVDPGTSRRVKWIAIVGNTLYSFTGDNAGDTQVRRSGNSFYAHNLTSGAQTWRRTFTGTINARDIGMSSDRVFAYIQSTGVVCMNASDGTTAWTQNSSAVVSTLQADGCMDWCDLSAPLSSMLCSPYTLYIRSTEDEAVVALRVTDGAVVWSSGSTGYGRFVSALIQGGRTLVAPTVTDASRRYVDIQTNAAVSGPLTTLAFGNDGCGIRSSTPDGYFGNGGGQACSFSLNKNLGHSNVKTDCGIGAVFADGTSFLPSTGCYCYPTRGNLATVPAGTFQFNQTAVQSERLEGGPALGNISAQVKGDNLDWWTYRKGQERTGSSTATVPSGMRLRWTYTPSQPYSTSNTDYKTNEYPTAPVAVGPYVFWAGTDGYVRCIDNRQGTQLWAYPTGGAINTAPTVWDGCVYAGSEDGYVYCIEAHTGRLVWRFRAAPIRRTMNMYGHLCSTWPVNSGVAIVNGMACFAAGMMSEYGTHVYALDAKSGAIRWQNNTSGSYLGAEFRAGFTPNGMLTVAGDKLYAKSLENRNGIFSLGDGALEPLPQSPTFEGPNAHPSNYGREMMMLDATHVMYGGRMFYTEVNDLEYNSRKRTFSVQALDTQNRPLYPEVSVIFNSTTAPAWDGQDFFVWLQDGGWGTGWVEKWSTSAYIQKVDQTRSANSGRADVALDGYPNPASQPGATPLNAGWIRPYDEIRGMALAANAICLVGLQDGQRDNPSGQQYLGVYPRGGTTATYKVALPGKAVSSGIALSRDGDVIVTLQNGTVLCFGATPLSLASRDIAKPTQTEGSSTQSFAHATANSAPAATADRPVTRLPPSEPSGDLSTAAPGMTVEIVGLPGTSTRPVLTNAQPAFACTTSQAIASGRSVALPQFSPARRTTPAIQSGLSVVAAHASSTSRVNVAGNAVDRDPASRWTPGGTGSQWIAIDLGTVQQVCGISAQWYAQRMVRQPVRVLIAQADEPLVEVHADIIKGRGSEVTNFSFPSRPARHVRLEFDIPDGQAIPHLYELALYGDGSLAAAR